MRELRRDESLRKAGRETAKKVGIVYTGGIDNPPTVAQREHAIKDAIIRNGSRMNAESLVLHLEKNGWGSRYEISLAVRDMLNCQKLGFDEWMWIVIPGQEPDDVEEVTMKPRKVNRISTTWDNFEYPDIMPLAREQESALWVLSRDDIEWIELELRREAFEHHAEDHVVRPLRIAEIEGVPQLAVVDPNGMLGTLSQVYFPDIGMASPDKGPVRVVDIVWYNSQGHRVTSRKGVSVKELAHNIETGIWQWHADRVLQDARITDRTKYELKNLLAVIHRDDGHYTIEHGLEKSIKDAQAKLDDYLAYAQVQDDEQQHYALSSIYWEDTTWAIGYETGDIIDGKPEYEIDGRLFSNRVDADEYLDSCRGSYLRPFLVKLDPTPFCPNRLRGGIDQFPTSVGQLVSHQDTRVRLRDGDDSEGTVMGIHPEFVEGEVVVVAWEDGTCDVCDPHELEIVSRGEKRNDAA